MNAAPVRDALLCLFFAAFATLASARGATAQAALPSAARIVVSGCPTHFNGRALQERVRIELLAAGVQTVRSVELYADNVALEDEPSSLATLRVTFPDCDESADEIQLGVADAQSGKHIERALAIADVPTTMQARAIALSLTELLRSEWRALSENTPVPEQAPDREQPPALGAPESAARDAREAEIARRFRLEWLAVGHLYAQTDSGDLSTVLAISKLLSPRARLQVGGSLNGGAGQGTDAHLFQATGRVLLALCSRTLNPSIEVGALLEAGWANLNGTHDGGGAIVTASAHATLRLPVAEAMEALITVQAGYVLVPMPLHAVSDDGETAHRVGFAGPTLGLGVGIATWL